MPRGSSLTLTDGALVGLFFMHRYRFCTIDQFARAANLNHSTAGDQLRHMERHGLLNHFGNTGLAGQGKTPKVYCLSRKGFELLRRESDIPPELLGSHKEVKVDAKWSPLMYHRLRTVDVMIAAEVAVRSRPHLSMVKTFLEYRRVKRAGRITRETTDFVGEEETAENRIIPDAAFVLANIETNKHALFFVEMDMATERIVSSITRDNRLTLHHKMLQYDRYLQSGRYGQTYALFGDFHSFTLLLVTLGEQRVENIRREMTSLPRELANYYRLTTFEKAMGDFLGPIWKSRSPLDTRLYPLVSERVRP